jgi:uroporphyrinogen III methyltransferase/synthase
LAKIAHVESIAVYSQVETVEPSHAVFDLLRRGEIDFVSFTSPNIARAFLGACDSTILGRFHRGETRIVTNGPRISGVVRERGLGVAAESTEPTSAGLIAALIDVQCKLCQ